MSASADGGAGRYMLGAVIGSLATAIPEEAVSWGVKLLTAVIIALFTGVAHGLAKRAVDRILPPKRH